MKSTEYEENPLVAILVLGVVFLLAIVAIVTVIGML